MNIFYINEDPIIAAQELADDHIRKMQIESAQMLCTTFHHYGIDAPYKKAHYNHPSTKWVRESIYHVYWLLEHGLEICDEFVIRYGIKGFLFDPWNCIEPKSEGEDTTSIVLQRLNKLIAFV